MKSLWQSGLAVSWSLEKVSRVYSIRAYTANSIPDALYTPALGPDRDGWAFLIKRVSLLLLSSVSKHPRCVANILFVRLE